MSIKTKSLKKAISKNTQVPVEIENIGYWAEDYLEENGYNINRGAGVDLPDYNVEIKTRCVNSKSAHTVGRMTTEAIINTPYTQSPVKDKIQQQYRVEYDNEGTIVSNEIYDFSEDWIQDLIKQSYEAGRQEIAQGMAGKNNTKTHGVGVFQRDKNKEQWQFRITKTGMEKIKSMSKQKSFKKLFEY